MKKSIKFIKVKFASMKKQNKTILFNIIGAFGVKGVSLIVSLFTMPGYMRYFSDNSILGVWLTLVSVLNWILNFDMGIGNGLRNNLVKPIVEKDYKTVKEYISSAYFILSGISIIFVIIGLIVSRYISWNSFFNISTEYISVEVMLKTVQIVFVGTIIQFVLRIITSVLYAMQKSFIPNMLQLLSTILLVVYVYIGKVTTPENSLIKLAYANILTVNIPLIIATIIIFATVLKGCAPKLSMYKKKYAISIVKVGGVFFWLQIMFMIINNTNEFLINWFVSSDSVVEYQIYFKLFTLAGTIVSLSLTPIWSAVTKAKVQKDYKWIKKLNNSLMIFGLFGCICEFLMIPILQFIINLWLGENGIEVNYYYATIFAISGSLFMWNKIVSSMANGFGEVKLQTIFLTLGAFLNFPLAYIGAKLCNSYISIVIANIISLLPYCIIQPLWMKHYLSKKCKNATENK